MSGAVEGAVMAYRGAMYPLRPTVEQEQHLTETAGVCRLIWNLALEQRREHWRNFSQQTGKNLNYAAQSRELTQLRAQVDFIRDVSQTAQEYALKDLDAAYQQAFKGLARFPDFRSKDRHETFTVKGRDVSVQRINRRWGKIRLPKMGWVKMRMPRTLDGKVAEATVAKTIHGWRVSVMYKTAAATPQATGIVGIDRGVTVPLMLSDGQRYVLPAGLSTIERKARDAQRCADRGKRGSVRNAAARRRVALLRAQQARVRKHWAHETTTAIARSYGTVVIEDLETARMTRSARGTMDSPGVNVAQKAGLNRAILNVGWRQIETFLAYKAYHLIKVDPRYTSQTCSACGVIDKASRKNQAVFICSGCGHRDNADRNAAVNIMRRGSAPTAEGKATSSMKRKPVSGKLSTISGQTEWTLLRQEANAPPHLTDQEGQNR